jgi:hypothetical protein
MSVVRRRRCGTRGTDDGSCGYRFVTAEAPVGFRHQLTIEMTPQGFKMIKTAQPPPLAMPARRLERREETDDDE